jgi:hypothetical protein
MGYTTTFEGEITVDPPLSKEEIDYLTKFCKTRRMNRMLGPYFIDGSGNFGQGQDDDIIDYNKPMKGQPGLWCQWIPTDDGEAIVWDEGEKFYESASWMKYIIDHFIGNEPTAQQYFPFFTGHMCNGTIHAQGEDHGDKWDLVVMDNEVFTKHYKHGRTTNLIRV